MQKWPLVLEGTRGRAKSAPRLPPNLQSSWLMNVWASAKAGVPAPPEDSAIELQMQAIGLTGAKWT